MNYEKIPSDSYPSKSAATKEEWRRMTPEKKAWIDKKINEFEVKVSPSEARVDAINDAYEEIRSIVT